ncbi:MAG: hypothetical protein FGM32_01830 [Candidatus Kapabacteria bacterium]|nr:hypothetical protein [Candidatus Kapabacteria bacterium]
MMSSSCILLVAFAAATVWQCPGIAQPLRQVSIAAVFGSPLPDDGSHRISVRWYNDPFQSTPLWQEDVDADIVGGRCELVLGGTVPLPDTVLRGNRIFVGYAVDGEAERRPRIELYATGVSLHAGYADMAARLDPRATGLVTSLNELSGPVSLVGTDGVSVVRKGSTLVVSAPTSSAEKGRVIGNGVASEYRVRPARKLLSDARVTFHTISPTTTLLTQLIIDTTLNELVFRVSAPLLPEECIDWSIDP